MARTSESFDKDLAVLITDTDSATHDAVDTVGMDV